MPGSYSHTTRVTGTVLTPTIYNGDHQNHIDHMEPQYIDDESANVAAMRATMDPGESGSENLATSLRDELRQLRHEILEMRGTTYHYQTAIQRVFSTTVLTCINLDLNAGFVQSFADSQYVEVRCQFFLSPVWIAGSNIDVQLLYTPITNTTGNVRLEYIVRVLRTGSVASELANTTTTLVNPTFNTLAALNFYTAAASNFAVNDYVQVIVRRDADHVDDTFAGDVRPEAVRILFNGHAGRP